MIAEAQQAAIDGIPYARHRYFAERIYEYIAFNGGKVYFDGDKYRYLERRYGIERRDAIDALEDLEIQGCVVLRPHHEIRMLVAEIPGTSVMDAPGTPEPTPTPGPQFVMSPGRQGGQS